MAIVVGRAQETLDVEFPRATDGVTPSSVRVFTKLGARALQWVDRWASREWCEGKADALRKPSISVRHDLVHDTVIQVAGTAPATANLAEVLIAWLGWAAGEPAGDLVADASGGELRGRPLPARDVFLLMAVLRRTLGDDATVVGHYEDPATAPPTPVPTGFKWGIAAATPAPAPPTPAPASVLKKTPAARRHLRFEEHGDDDDDAGAGPTEREAELERLLREARAERDALRVDRAALRERVEDLGGDSDDPDDDDAAGDADADSDPAAWDAEDVVWRPKRWWAFVIAHGEAAAAGQRRALLQQWAVEGPQRPCDARDAAGQLAQIAGELLKPEPDIQGIYSSIAGFLLFWGLRENNGYEAAVTSSTKVADDGRVDKRFKLALAKARKAPGSASGTKADKPTKPFPAPKDRIG